MNILIVDDDPRVCNLYQYYLRQEGWTTDCRHTWRAGIDQACQSVYDLVLLDVMLPDANSLQRIEEFPTYRVILMSVEDIPLSVKEALVEQGQVLGFWHKSSTLELVSLLRVYQDLSDIKEMLQ